MNKGMNMKLINYRTDILDMVRRKTAQDYQLPADSLMLYEAAEVVAENWFINCRPDGFQFECGMDAQDAVNDSLLTHLVMVKYFELEQQFNNTGAGF